MVNEEQERALDQANSWLFREFGSLLRPSQRGTVRTALQCGYLYGSHDHTDPDLVPVGTAYIDASERLGHVPVIVRRLNDYQYYVFAALETPLDETVSALLGQLGGQQGDDGVMFLVPSLAEAESLVAPCQQAFDHQRRSST